MNLIFAIDTEQYAGNFERPMCAYVTGVLGECGAGKDAAEAAERELPADVREWFDEHVRHEPDEGRCHRPVQLIATPGWFNYGGGHCREGTDPELIRADYERAVRSYWDRHIRAEESNVAIRRSAEDGQRIIADLRKQLEESIAKGPGRYPAYLSVGILLDEMPPADVVAVMKERAHAFGKMWPAFAKWNEPITVTGFRLLKEETITTEVPLP